MNKRILGTILWFQAAWTAGAMLTYFFGFPQDLDLVLGIATGALVAWDPTHALWPQGRRVVTEIPDRKAGDGKLATE